MILYFPALYKDETIYSIASRIAKACNFSYYETIKGLLGSESYHYINPLVGISLCKLYAQLPDEYRYSQENMLNDHTLLPLYKINLLNTQYLQLVKDLDEDISRVARTIIKSNNKNHNDSIKYCEQCIKDDNRLYGEAFIHRQHQLGGVLVCSKHRCILKSIKIRKMVKDFVNLNDIGIYANNENIIDLNKDEMKLALQIAEDVDFILMNNEKMCTGEINKNLYIKALIDTEFMEKGVIKRKKIVEQISSMYPESFLGKIGCDDLTNNDGKMLTLMYRKVKTIIDPVKNIVFIRSILGSIDKLIMDERSIVDLIKEDTNGYSVKFKSSKEEGTQDYEAKKRLYRTRILEVKRNISTVKRSYFKNNFQGEYRWLQRYDREWLDTTILPRNPSEPKLVNEVKREKYRRELMELIQGNIKITPKQIWNKMSKKYEWLKKYDTEWVEYYSGLLYRSKGQLRCCYRRELLKNMEQFPNYSRRKLSDMSPKAYAWLIENDNEWVEENLPSKRKLNDEERKKIYREKVKQIIKENPNITKMALYREVEYAYRWLKKNDKEWIESLI